MLVTALYMNIFVCCLHQDQIKAIDNHRRQEALCDVRNNDILQFSRCSISLLNNFFYKSLVL